jgi:CRP/FNR family transcriptional regulator, anaerobic regulatory protein
MSQPNTKPCIRLVARPHATTSAAEPLPGLSACASCSLRNGCLARSLEGSELQCFSLMARLKRKLRRSARVFCAGDALSAVYVVRSGTFKAVAVSKEGHQKITGFYLPGDLLGLDAIAEGVYCTDAIALEDSELCVLPAQQLEAVARTLPALQRDLVRALSAEIGRHRSLLVQPGMDAEQRVAALLLNLAERYHRLGYARDALLLHVTREEIASYLCLSPETVSRVLSRLHRKGVLAVRQRHIGFPDRAQLAAAAAW